MNADEVPAWEDIEKQAVSLIDKGHMFQRLGQDEEALASFDKAVTICRGMGDKSDPVALALTQALDNKANALVNLERPAKAIPWSDEALEASDLSISLHRTVFKHANGPKEREPLAEAVHLCGHIQTKLGQTGDAHDCFREAVQLKGNADGLDGDTN